LDDQHVFLNKKKEKKEKEKKTSRYIPLHAIGEHMLHHRDGW